MAVTRRDTAPAVSRQLTAQVSVSSGMEEMQKEPSEVSTERGEKEKAGPSAQGVGCIADAVAESDGSGVAAQETLGLANLSSKLIVSNKPAMTDIGDLFSSLKIFHLLNLMCFLCNCLIHFYGCC